MRRGWPRSLQLRLAFRVAALYVVATVIVIAFLMSRAYDTVRSVGDRELVGRASEIARSVSIGADGRPRVDLPPNLTELPDAKSGLDVFAVRDAASRIITAAPEAFGDVVATWPMPAAEPVRFSIGLGHESRGYDGLSIRVETIAGPLAVSVGRSSANAAAAYSLLRKFIHDTIWAVSLLVLAALAIGTLAIRGGLKPVRELSDMAATIAPHRMSVRLPDEALPSEIAPLVRAVNRALDRVEQGFNVQRQFTANAAHELRTPLAIITAAVDELEGDERFAELRGDVARMNRLVEQLLRVARLDAVGLDVTETVDLNEVARAVVASMAPWALARERTIGLTGPDAPVRAKGNTHAISDALRNLIENAVLHSPARTEVMVRVDLEGSVSVADRGPGVPPADRERIFDRFWRGRGAQFEGAGLGLAIVKEIMKAHGGMVSVMDRPLGGAIFTLCFAPIRSESEVS
jgi:signal transduction histidine kinase